MRLVVYNEKSGLLSQYGMDGFVELLAGDENISLPAFMAGDCPRLSENDQVVTAGGDGTVSAVISRLLEPGTPAEKLPLLFVMPGGSSNSIARSLKLPFHPAGWRRFLSQHHTVYTDMGRANGRPFMLCVSGGASARTVAAAESFRGKGRSGPYYVLATLMSLWKLDAVKATADGTCGDAIRGPEIIAANMPVFGGLFNLPHVSPFDGYFDVFAPRALHMMAWYAGRKYRGKSFAAKELTIEGEGVYQVDGEPGGQLPVHVTMEHRRVKLALPR